MKLDLEDLERAALASPAGLCFQEGKRLQAGAPTCTAITLALIARIRELEAALETAADDLGALRMAHRASVLTELLDKGAVLS